MQQVDCIAKLLGFQGFYVRGMRIQKDEDVEKVILDLGRERRYICSGCGREVYTKHSSYLQEVRHLHLWKYLTILRFEKVKVRCPTCGVRVERLDFLDKHARLTKVIGDNYFSRPTTIIFTVFFQENQWFYLLTSVRHPLTHIPPYETQKSLSNLAFNKASFGSSSPLRQSFEWVSGELVIFKIVPSVYPRLKYDTQKN